MTDSARLDISIIVPLYHGGRFVAPILSMVDRNICNCSATVELIFVKDSIDDVVSLPVHSSRCYPLRMLRHSQRQGIHQARLTGLAYAKGTFVLFLDQDDRIKDNYLSSQQNAIEGADAVVCNGYKFRDGKMHYIYNNRRKQLLACNPKAFFLFENHIVSPGQVLLRKAAIPPEWQCRAIQHNGADDYFLWYLLMAKKQDIRINKARLFAHTSCGTNASLDYKEMQLSLYEVAARLQRLDCLNPLEKALLPFVITLNERAPNFLRRFLVDAYGKFFIHC